MDMEKAIKETHAYRCLECGKCTAVCPLARLNPIYSPRLTVERALWGDDLADDRLLWSCLTCEACSERCQSDVAYSEFIRHLRAQAWKGGQSGECAHGGALQTLMRMMTKELQQNRLGWLRRLKVAERSDSLYFVGCLPYFEVIFQEFGFPAHKVARSTVKVLNRLGIIPMVLENERCCGHDLLWEGDVDDFRRLAELNLQTIEESGAQRVVTSCAECYHTLATEYPRYVGGLKAEVVHISELLAEELAVRDLGRRRKTTLVTYQDPCRLGRLSGLYEQPRQVITALPGIELMEMERNKAQALCCGTSCWTNCGADNKEIQVERLREAKATGADLLITACPKCQIHFRCAMNDEKVGEEARIGVEDLVVLAANAL